MCSGKPKIELRWMIRRDLPEVLDIEAECFEFPWSEAQFIDCLRQRNCIGMVVTEGDKVIAFVIYELHKRRLVLLTVAVAWSHQGRGIGRMIVERLFHKLSTARRASITTVVRESNLGALNFFKAHGFLAECLLPGHYDDTDDDAIVMQYRLPEVSTVDTHRTGVAHG